MTDEELDAALGLPPLRAPTPAANSEGRGRGIQAPNGPRAPSSAAADIEELIARIAAEEGVPPSLALSLARIESGLNPQAVGPRTRHGQAVGLFQIMPAFRSDYGVEDPRDPQDNARGALRTLRKNFERFGDWSRAVAAHHAGAGAVERAGGVPDTADANMATADYVQRVLADADADELAQPRAGGREQLLHRLDAIDADIAGMQPNADEYGFRPGAAIKKGALGLAATGALALRGAERFVTGDERLTGPLADMATQAYRDAPTDPNMAEWARVIDEAPDLGAAILEGAWFALKNPAAAGNFLAEMAPAMVAGLPFGGVTGALAARGAAALGAGRGVAQVAGTAGFGAGLNSSQVVLQGLGAHYAEALDQGLADDEAVQYATDKTIGEVGPNALAGALMAWMPVASRFQRAARRAGLDPEKVHVPLLARIKDTAIQSQIQGAGGAAGAFMASTAVGEDPRRSEMVLEWLGESLTAPVEVGAAALSRLRTAKDAQTPLEATQLPVTPVVTPEELQRAAAPDVPLMPADQADTFDAILERLRRRADADLASMRIGDRRNVVDPAQTARPPQAPAPEAASADAITDEEVAARLREAAFAEDNTTGPGVDSPANEVPTAADVAGLRGTVEDLRARRQRLQSGSLAAEVARLRERAAARTTAPAPDVARETTTPVATVAPTLDLEAMREQIRAMRSRLDERAHEAATSPTNDLPEPTEAQKKAGNYQKGHARIGGLDVSIENPAGSKRRPEWPTLRSHYGYIRRTEGADGDHVDAFIKPGTPDDWRGTVYVVDQVDPNKDPSRFDEHKVMLGFDSIEEARQAYLENYAPDWQGLKAITPAAFDAFRAWLERGDTKRPFAWQGEQSDASSATVPEQAAPPKPVAPPPQTSRKAILGKHGPRDIHFQSAQEAELFDAYSRLRKKTARGVDDGYISHLEGRMSAFLGAPVKNIGALAVRYHEAVMNAARAAGAGETVRAPLVREVIAAARDAEQGKVPTEEAVDPFKVAAEREAARQRAENEAAVARRNAWRSRVRAWFVAASDGDTISDTGTGQTYMVVEKVRGNGVRVKSLAAVDENGNVLPDGRAATGISMVGDRIEGLDDGGIDQDTGSALPETPGQSLATSLGKLLEDGDAVIGRANNGQHGGAPAEEAGGDRPGEQTSSTAPASSARTPLAAEVERLKQKKADAPAPAESVDEPQQAGTERPRDADGQPIYEEGERVVIRDTAGNRELAGRHGEITRVHVMQFQALFGGAKSEKSYHYTVRTDGGAEAMFASKELEPETGQPPAAVPDIKIGASFMVPERARAYLASIRQSINRAQGQLGRARVEASKREHAQRIRDLEAQYASVQATIEAWERAHGRPTSEVAPTAPRPAAADLKPLVGTIEVVETKHGKTGAPLWVAKIGERVERDVYDQLAAAARRHGGKWSKWSKGFEFYSAEGARSFADQVAKTAAPAATPPAAPAPSPTPPASAPAPAPTPRQPSRKEADAAAAREAARAAYFTPGNVVKGYGGFDEVLEYRAPEKPGGEWRVRVHAVQQDIDRGWQRIGKPQDARWHATEPDARELAAGPVARLDYTPGASVQYTEPRADGQPFANAPDRGVKPAEPSAAAGPTEPTSSPAPAKPTPDQSDADEGEAWWKSLTNDGRRRMLEAVGYSLPPAVLWKYVPDDAKAALLEARSEVDLSDVPPVDATDRPAYGETTEQSNARTEPSRGPQAPGGAGNAGEGAGAARAPEGERGTGRGTGGTRGADGRDDGDAGEPRGRAGGDEQAAAAGARGPAQPGPERSGRSGDRAGDRVSDRVGVDHRIGPEGITRQGSWKETARRNLDIIELSKRIEAEGRAATPQEQALLAQYTGWGAVEMRQQVFPTPHAWQRSQDPDKPFWPENARDDGWRALSQRALELLTRDEQREALSSSQYAHYTSDKVIRSIYSALQRMGFTGGRVLEPGMGNGLFAMLMPEAMYKASRYTGIERDILTGRIAKLLLPQQNVIVGDFVKQKLPRDYFDAAIGNPPFQSVRIYDDPAYKKHRFFLHDYFFAKTVDSVRPGGLLVFVTSNGTLDKANDAARAYLAERADLLGAVRLPQTAFKHNAGTEVVTDVLFLQRRAPGEPAAGEAWLGLEEVAAGDGKALVNEYFARHPDMVLGTHSLAGTMYRKDSYTVLPREGDIEAQFAEAVARLPANVYRKRTESAATKAAPAFERDFNPKTKKEGGLYRADDGTLKVLSAGSGIPVEQAVGRPLRGREAEFLSDYVDLREALKDAQIAQWNDADWEGALKRLQRQYQAFTDKHGPIQAFTTIVRKERDEDGNETEIPRKRFKHASLLRRADVEYALVWALEEIRDDVHIVQSDLLRGRTIAKPKPVEVKTAADALAVSLDQVGRLDLADVASRAGVDVPAAIEQLGDLIYEAPGGGWQLADEYLSGDVVAKLDEAEIAARDDKRFRRNVEALRKVQPKPLGHDQITVRLGASWVPPEYVADFAREVLESPASVTYMPEANIWNVEGGNLRTRDVTSQWGMSGRPPLAILEAVLNNRSLTVRRQVDEKKTEVDPEATAKLNDIAAKMREAFAAWIWTDADRAGRVLEIYNRKFNNLAPRRFDGSHLSLPGVSLKLTLLPHQKRGIWRAIQTGNVYAAHAVGAGKTFMSIGAAMEQKRLGLIRKPMFVVPNHMLEQFAAEFKQMYPAANVMVADDENFAGDNRRRFVAQAAVNAPDAIVITHSAFGRVPLSAATYSAYVERLVDEIDAALAETPKSERLTRRQLEQRKEALQRRLEGRINRDRADNVVTFEQMGVDYLVVDEAHLFRKLDFFTNRSGRDLKGISPEGSAAAMDLHMKVQWLAQQRPGRTHMFLSGTPVTNTMGELFTLQRFFDEEGMRADGIDHFDAWANAFGEMKPGFERNAAGDYEVVTRFAKFVNVPELMKRIRQFMDVLTTDQLGELVKRPDLEGGRVQNIIVKPSERLTAYMQKVLRARIERSRKWKPTAQEPNNPDPLIAIIGDARVATLDDRFFAPGSESNPNTKLNRMIDEIIADYRKYKDEVYTTDGKPDPVKGGTQIVFSPIGFGAGVRARGFDPRAWISKRLQMAGIKASEVVWAEDLDSDAKKAKVYADMRAGRVKILFGSPAKLGTGVNVQKRLKVLHYLAPPWYPADVEQPHGRILRQGNQNERVVIKWYATEGTYDSTQWDMVARKARFIAQAMAGDEQVRTLEDVSEVSQYEMASALASGDQRVMQLAGLSADIERLQRLKAAHYTEQQNIRGRLRDAEARIAHGERRLKKLKPALDAHRPLYGSEFVARVGDRAFDKRADFGDALRAAYNRALVDAIAGRREQSKTKLGEIGGLPLMLAVGGIDAKAKQANAALVLQITPDEPGEYGYSEQVWAERGTMGDDDGGQSLAMSVQNAYNGIPRRAQTIEDGLAEARRDKARYEKVLGAPFPDERLLAEKIAERAQIQEQLAAEGKKAEDLAPPPVGDPLNDPPLAGGETLESRRAVNTGAPQSGEGFVARALNLLAAADEEVFRYPIAEGKTLAEVVRAIEPAWTVEPFRAGAGETRWAVRNPTGGWALVTQKGREVEVDVLAWGQQAEGSKLYHAIANYAHNNGLRFVGDSGGVTLYGALRRAEMMLASAMKFGTTAHVEPHEWMEHPGDRWRGNVAALAWHPGNDAANLEALARTVAANTLHFAPAEARSARYDFQRGEFVAADGRVLGDADLDELARRTRQGFRLAAAGKPVDSADASALDAAPSEGPFGRGTLKRALVLDSLLRLPEERRGSLLAELLRSRFARLRGAEPAATRGLKELFSRSARLAELRPSQRAREIEQTIAAFVARFPGALALDIRVVDTREDGPAADRESLSEFAEGAIKLSDDGSGTVSLIAAALPTVERAQQVLLHEIVGHYGLRALLGERFGEVLASVKAQARARAAGIRNAAEFAVAEFERTGKLPRTPLEIQTTDPDYATWDAVRVLYPDAAEHVVADNVLARMAETGARPRLLERVLLLIRRALRAAGFKLDYSAAELKGLVADAAKMLREGRNLPGGRGAANVRAAAESEGEPEVNPLESRATTVTSGALADAWPPLARKAHDAVFDALARGRTFGLWARTVGTQMAKARDNPEFARVFNRAQKFIDDIARYALRAEGLAPKILPKVGGLRDVPNALMQAVGKRGLSSADNAWLARVLAEGTLAGMERPEAEQAAAQQDDGTAAEPTASPFAGRVWTDEELRSRFGATDAQIALYREARAAIDQSLADAGRATMLSALRAAGFEQPAIDSIEGAPSLAELRLAAERMIDEAAALNPDDQATQEWAARNKGNLERIQQRVEQLQEAGYAPLMRFGRYYLSAFDSDGQIAHFARFDSQAELLRERRRLERENPGLRFDSGEVSLQEHELFRGVDPHTLMLFAKEAGFADEALQKWYELAVADRSALKRLIHRKGTPGFSLDARRTLASFITSNARFSSNVVNAPAMNELARSIRDGGVKDEAIRLNEYVLNPNEEAARLRGVLFAWYLGGSAAAGIVNMTQPVLMTFPYLARFGVRNAAAAMRRGLAAAAAAMRGKDVDDAELAAAMKRAEADGLTQPSEIYALMAASRGEFRSPLMQAFHTTWGANFALTEAFNRTTTFAAAFIAAREAGMDNPYSFAKRAIYDTQGLYTRANRPNWARGAIGATIFTFKQFSIAYVEFLKQLATDGTLPKTQLAIALGLLVLASGLQGLPGADDLDDLIDALGQWLGYGTNVRQAKRQVFERVLGETLGNVALYGISTQMGLDLASRLGMGNLIPGTGALIPANPNKARDAAELAGPLGSLVANSAAALERLFRGDYGGAVQSATPVAVRNALKGVQMLGTGEARDDAGRRIMDVNPLEAATKIVGFNPQRLAAEGRRIREIRYDENIVNARAAEIRETWALGIVRDDPVAVRRAQDMLRQWNEQNPSMRIRVRPQDVLRRVRDMRRSRQERFIRSVPSSLRQRAREAFEEGDEE